MTIVRISENIFRQDALPVVQVNGGQDQVLITNAALAQSSASIVVADGFGDRINIQGIADSLGSDAVVVGTVGDNSSGGNIVSVAGLVQTRTGEHTGVVLHGSGNKLSVSGQVESDGDGVVIDGLFSKTAITGTLTADADGLTVTDDFARIVNKGFVSAGDLGFNLESNGARIANSGFVHGQEAGILAISEGGHVSNTGLITGGAGIALANDDGNAGTAASRATIFNAGEIVSGRFGILALGDDVKIVNGSEGSIKSIAGGVGVRMSTSDGEAERLLNRGEISSSTTAVQGGDGREHVFNNGVMTGDVHLGGGEDVFVTSRGEIVGLIDAGAGNDVVLGSAGDDEILGGLGRDQLNGGAGADNFVFESVQDSIDGQRDVIQGFRPTQGDHLDLHLIDANAGAAGDQPFAFIGDSAFSNQAGELKSIIVGDNTLVSADVNGDGGADFAVLLKGHIAMQVSDFVL